MSDVLFVLTKNGYDYYPQSDKAKAYFKECGYIPEDGDELIYCFPPGEFYSPSGFEDSNLAFDEKPNG